MGIRAVFGEEKNVLPASVESWLEIEEWVGQKLPTDYKDFVDTYGEAVVAGHLCIPHPRGEMPLLKFMRQHRVAIHESCSFHPEVPERISAVWENLVPWSYHNWNGDVGLLLPPEDEDGRWDVAIAYRQLPEFLVFRGGVSEFLSAVLGEGEWPMGWPRNRPVWMSMEEADRYTGA